MRVIRYHPGPEKCVSAPGANSARRAQLRDVCEWTEGFQNPSAILTSRKENDLLECLTQSL